MKIKVMIADDNSFIREGMKIILSSFDEFEVIGTVQDGAEAVSFCRDHEVDVAMLDIRMPNMNGVEATRLIAAEGTAKPLILTTFDDDEFIIEAIHAGARGYLLKNNDPEQIRDAIKSVYNNHHVLQGVVVDRLKSGLTESASQRDSNADRSCAEPAPHAKLDLSLFTDRELEVMTQIAKGLSNKGIAKKLFLSEGTVANHITSILNKTGLAHRTQIAIYFLTGEVMTQDE
ncbi:response regulator transcription factor [Paenibacillus physcomitrellae]|uniref:DNA-binding response regulator n=1 Tax=Paenibacillus physcomitrellae TaxID=1619311 RepID=A0ABQ1FQ88_9BACL|nr:response regulator transcription factor [Paenibacillus physcomitrellae]GGA23952.1 DNA-binding response regulator [Paenibacillus physcomitrellae]